MTIEEATTPPPPPVDVWPDNWLAVCVFIAIGTQWRVAMGGAYGLDYNVLYHKLDRMKLDAEEYLEVEAGVRTLEDAALREMQETAEGQRKK